MRKNRLIGCVAAMAAVGLLGVNVGSEKTEAAAAPSASVSYSVHGQTYGDQKAVRDGQQAGSTGKAKRLEALTMNITGDGGVRYQVHGQTYGWQGIKTDGKMAGSKGKAKRAEAIKIELTGNLAKTHDIFYRVHGQTYGWQGWKKNGQQAGSTGKAKRMEALEVKLVEKPAFTTKVSVQKRGNSLYDVTIDLAGSGTSAIQQIEVPTWGDKNGQNDIRWYKANKVNDKQYKVTVDALTHKETGTFRVHVYAKYLDASMQYLGSSSFNYSEPVKEVPVSGVNLSINKNPLTVGDTAKLTTSVNPTNATNKAITYSSSNNGVATVDASGNISAKSAGTTTITAKASNGVSKSVTVTVQQAKQTPVINLQKINIPWGTVWNDSMLKQGFINGTDEYGNSLSYDRLKVTQREPMNTRKSGNYIYDVEYGGLSTQLWVVVGKPIYDKTAVRAEMLRLVNELRASVGSQPLIYDQTLNAASDVRAQELTSVYQHYRPNGQDCGTAIVEIDEDFFDSHLGYGENISAGSGGEGNNQEFAKNFFEAWKRSSGHKENMTNPKWKYFGFSYDSSGFYAQQFFSGGF